MKKILMLLLVITGFAIAAKSSVFDICNSSFCYVLTVQDAKKWEWKTDLTGRKYVRVYFYEPGKLLDIPADRLTVKLRK